ncbi:MAG TPA: hypothetical protein VIK54_04295 [Acidimicrobiia bacterium]
MHDELNGLARRGSPRGFDEVFAAAAESAERESVERDVRGDDLDTIPFVTPEPIGPRRRPLGSMIAAAGVAALVLVGAFAVSAVVGSGGAGSAAGAVRRLADAVSHEDPLAAADVLAPDEVRSLHGTLDAAANKARELQLVQTASAPLAGVDFNIDGLHLSTQSLGDGYAKVTVDAGSFNASTHKAQFSALMQKVLRDTHDNSSQTDLAKLASNQNLPTFVVTVRRGGRWYVSAAYTVLEYVRESNHLPAGDFGSGERAISSLGADSPDAAVQDSMRALQREDWSKLMEMVSPSEIPVYDYRDALTTLANRNQAQSDRSASGFTIDSMSTTSAVNGGTAKVTLKASGTTDSGKWSLDGGCFSAPGETVSVSCGGESVLGIAGLTSGGVDQGSQITVVERDGRWFMSPVGTVLDVVDHFISQLDRRSLFVLLNIPNQIPPDGRLTLGRPIVLRTPTNRGIRVLTFDGHKGESLLGFASAKPTVKPKSASSIDDFPRALVRVFRPDGSELGDDGGLLEGRPLTLPADATYTVVVERFYGFAVTDDVTVTIWDTADAPASARQQPGSVCLGPSPGASGASTKCSSSGTSTCTYTIDGGQTCSSETTVSPGLGIGLNGGGSTSSSGSVSGPAFPPPTATSSATSTPHG